MRGRHPHPLRPQLPRPRHRTASLPRRRQTPSRPPPWFPTRHPTRLYSPAVPPPQRTRSDHAPIDCLGSPRFCQRLRGPRSGLAVATAGGFTGEGATMSEVYEGYTGQYCEISTTLSCKCAAASALDGEKKQQKLSEIQADVQESESLFAVK